MMMMMMMGMMGMMMHVAMKGAKIYQIRPRALKPRSCEEDALASEVGLGCTNPTFLGW